MGPNEEEKPKTLCVGSHPLWGGGAFSRRGLNPIKLASQPSQLAGRLR